MVTRYAMASHEDKGVSAGRKCDHSPETMLQAIKQIPAAVICHPAFTEFEIPTDLYFEYKEPAAHEMLARTRSASATIPLLPSAVPPAGCSCINCCPNNMSTPVEPTINPIMVALLRKFSRHLPLSSTTNQIGPEASRIAASELGTYCSAQSSVALPPTSSSKPLTMAGI